MELARVKKLLLEKGTSFCAIMFCSKKVGGYIQSWRILDSTTWRAFTEVRGVTTGRRRRRNERGDKREGRREQQKEMIFVPVFTRNRQVRTTEEHHIQYAHCLLTEREDKPTAVLLWRRYCPPRLSPGFSPLFLAHLASPVHVPRFLIYTLRKEPKRRSSLCLYSFVLRTLMVTYLQ